VYHSKFWWHYLFKISIWSVNPDSRGFGFYSYSIVVDPGKGVYADPVNGGAILGKGGTGPQRREQRASVEPGQGKVKT
jgi:hypothetical protein